MNRKGFTPIVILLIVAGIIAIGGIWHYARHDHVAVNTNSDDASISMNNFLAGWKFRIPIFIDNSKASASLENFQLPIDIDTKTLIEAGKLMPDCSDVRFTDSDGSSSLPYSFASDCGLADTKIWVKTASIPAQGSTTIYFYFGNKSADFGESLLPRNLNPIL